MPEWWRVQIHNDLSQPLTRPSKIKIKIDNLGLSKNKAKNYKATRLHQKIAEIVGWEWGFQVIYTRIDEENYLWGETELEGENGEHPRS